MLILTVTAFGLAWWLGLYLIARNPRKPLLRRVGFGLCAYALAMGTQLLRSDAPPPLDLALARLQLLLGFLPAIFWTGATVLLLPETALRRRLNDAWRWALAPLTGVLLLIAALFGALDNPGAPGAPYVALALLVLLPLLGMLALMIALRKSLGPAPVSGLLIVATLFFGLGAALLFFPPAIIDQGWMALGIGLDLALLGVAAAIFDAFEEGERLRYDIVRSLIGAGGAALLFGGQVGLAMAVTAPNPALTALLLGSIAAAIAFQVWSGPLQTWLDRLAFSGNPTLQHSRAELQASAEALPRVNNDAGLALLDEAEFARLTRRALSSYGDLARLATNPLTYLPMIEHRVHARGAPDIPLERAIELKRILAESIARLKPHDGDFGISDEWRHYNALYFPYVVGIRPYSRRADHRNLDSAARRALEWMAAQVPERTLYNWQNSAARLIAADLRADMAVTGSNIGTIPGGNGSQSGAMLTPRDAANG